MFVDTTVVCCQCRCLLIFVVFVDTPIFGDTKGVRGQSLVFVETLCLAFDEFDLFEMFSNMEIFYHHSIIGLLCV